mmetsp:Transcript_46966/g.132483  ORF Transcript_46966/g.132483 Transcript_46966/m.132483 type:complete len:551 (-) Transcript_46966:95-1747(-)
MDAQVSRRLRRIGDRVRSVSQASRSVSRIEVLDDGTRVALTTSSTKPGGGRIKALRSNSLWSRLGHSAKLHWPHFDSIKDPPPDESFNLLVRLAFEVGSADYQDCQCVAQSLVSSDIQALQQLYNKVSSGLLACLDARSSSKLSTCFPSATDSVPVFDSVYGAAAAPASAPLFRQSNSETSLTSHSEFSPKRLGLKVRKQKSDSSLDDDSSPKFMNLTRQASTESNEMRAILAQRGNTAEASSGFGGVVWNMDGCPKTGVAAPEGSYLIKRYRNRTTVEPVKEESPPLVREEDDPPYRGSWGRLKVPEIRASWGRRSEHIDTTGSCGTCSTVPTEVLLDYAMRDLPDYDDVSPSLDVNKTKTANRSQASTQSSAAIQEQWEFDEEYAKPNVPEGRILTRTAPIAAATTEAVEAPDTDSIMAAAAAAELEWATTRRSSPQATKEDAEARNADVIVAAAAVAELLSAEPRRPSPPPPDPANEDAEAPAKPAWLQRKELRRVAREKKGSGRPNKVTYGDVLRASYEQAAQSLQTAATSLGPQEADARPIPSST